jgi:hypothetical protein
VDGHARFIVPVAGVAMRYVVMSGPQSSLFIKLNIGMFFMAASLVLKLGAWSKHRPRAPLDLRAQLLRHELDNGLMSLRPRLRGLHLSSDPPHHADPDTVLARDLAHTLRASRERCLDLARTPGGEEKDAAEHTAILAAPERQLSKHASAPSAVEAHGPQ